MNRQSTTPKRTARIVGAAITLATVAVACGRDDTASTLDTATSVTASADAASAGTGTGSTATAAPGTGDGTGSESQMFPDVIDATAELDSETWTISVTISSPYDSPERYADAWRVVGSDDTVYGERILTHDHASEQPFTRSESGIEIPDDVDEVTIEGRDLENGYGGETFQLTLPR